ncbi:UNVERIFIED_CONTAM: hypothetical protein Scaly_0260900 [Sesamum calycinum]|uniref:Retroviral polymerase SH3-like domain-containing protein n=1 Tax=Sesamum calycinum TaxID=2727403 RepID=A0AAW2S998_9LAMI
MSNTLFAKKKIGFVDGTIQKPVANSPDLGHWMRGDAMVKGWLKSVMDKEIRSTVRYAKTAREIWVDLEERFGKKQISNSSKQTIEAAAFRIQSTRYSKDMGDRRIGRKEKEKCGLCQKVGHIEDQCFEIRVDNGVKFQSKVMLDYNAEQVYVHETKADKFGENGRLCVFVGYPNGQKGYRVYDVESQKIYTSRDVIFLEDKYPFKQKDDEVMRSKCDLAQDTNHTIQVQDDESMEQKLHSERVNTWEFGDVEVINHDNENDDGLNQTIEPPSMA